MLDAPTNEAWIDPWVEHLGGLGVDLRLECPVQGLVVAGDRVAAEAARMKAYWRERLTSLKAQLEAGERDA